MYGWFLLWHSFCITTDAKSIISSYVPVVVDIIIWHSNNILLAREFSFYYPLVSEHQQQQQEGSHHKEPHQQHCQGQRSLVHTGAIRPVILLASEWHDLSPICSSLISINACNGTTTIANTTITISHCILNSLFSVVSKVRNAGSTLSANSSHVSGVRARGNRRWYSLEPRNVTSQMFSRRTLWQRCYTSNTCRQT